MNCFSDWLHATATLKLLSHQQLFIVFISQSRDVSLTKSALNILLPNNVKTLVGWTETSLHPGSLLHFDSCPKATSISPELYLPTNSSALWTIKLIKPDWWRDGLDYKKSIKEIWTSCWYIWYQQSMRLRWLYHCGSCQVKSHTRREHTLHSGLPCWQWPGYPGAGR